MPYIVGQAPCKDSFMISPERDKLCQNTKDPLRGNTANPCNGKTVPPPSKSESYKKYDHKECLTMFNGCLRRTLQ